MANNATALNTISSNVLLCSVGFKFIAMIIGILGNVTVIIHTFLLTKEKTATSYLVGNLALADLLVCLTFYPIWIVELIQVILNIDNDQDLFCKFSRSTIWAFMFVSIATLLAITIDRYLYIVKPLRYPQIVTRQRLFLAVSGIWFTACCIFIVHFIHDMSHNKIKLRSLCDIPVGIRFFTYVFVAYLPLTLIFFFNFHILSVGQKQRKRILAETTIVSGNSSTEGSADRMNYVVGFFAALKTAKTFAIVVAALTICVLIPIVVAPIVFRFSTLSRRRLWYAVFHFELFGINSVVNAYIYEMRHVKYRKAYLHILYKLFSFHKACN